MLYDKIILRLADKFEDDFEISLKPDHPFLVTGPDLLIGGNGMLIAFFSPKHDEINDIDKLLVRLSLVRLAFPSHLRCILIVDFNEIEKEFVRICADNFHQVISYSDNKVYKQSVDVEEDNERVDVIPQGLREKAFIKAHILYRRSLRLIENRLPNSDTVSEKYLYDNFNKYSNLEIPTWALNKRSKITNKYKVNWDTGTIVIFDDFNNLNSLYNKLNKHFVNIFKVNYQIDNGIPYHTNPTVNLLMVNEVPALKFDPLKPIRAAAFAGWTLMNANNSGEIESASEYIMHTLKRREVFR